MRTRPVLREAKDEAEAENFGLEAISLVGLEDCFQHGYSHCVTKKIIHTILICTVD